MSPIKALIFRVDQLVTMARRATLAPTLVRATVAVAAFASLVVAYPPGLLCSAATLVFAAIAVLPALWPRGAIPTMVMIVAVLGWVGTGSGFDVRATTFIRMLAMAALLYVVHTGSALAAVLPYDAIITKGLFTPWLTRGVTVLVMTAILAVFAADLPRFTHGHHAVIASIVGLFVTLAITGYLTFLGKRKREG